MKEPILIIMAAGAGSRNGSLKQIETVGDNNESLIEFSIYDALEAGFKRLIMIIRRDQEDNFEKALVKKIRPFIEVDYAYQDIQDIPKRFEVPEDRVKLWGTTHALLACRNLVDAPFAVINSNNYYGKDAFKIMYHYLITQVTSHQYAMIGYVLKNTLTDFGTVARGICTVRDGELTDIVERHRIKNIDDIPHYSEDNENWYPLDPDSIVSMNFWGFAPSVMDLLYPIFQRFLAKNLEEDPLRCELVLSTAIDELIKEQRISIRVLRTEDKWYGLNYREDKEYLMLALTGFKANNMYPPSLWTEKEDDSDL